ncbi:MAG TPA: Hpt domain-containing protein [Acidobacteriaceae bacterium]|jgi:HPt (histidine-containing phosphotransfer) domain-containing protein|nr:Hpt domain-containing protein [Acidobacteriaceae bacterium]
MSITTPAAKTAQLLAVLWERNRPVVEERVAILESAIHTLGVTQTLAPETQVDAANVAHKLAGTLGMFGYPRGTELARMIEEVLEMTDPLTPTESKLLQEWVVELKTVLAK